MKVHISLDAGFSLKVNKSDQLLILLSTIILVMQHLFNHLLLCNSFFFLVTHGDI